ncbi:hypothetical protein [Nostoc sp. WHI]|uniref:hypothetical protein n=1 Tax=Nostoc sp. WHI TaxID=2650611 RepID=UPI0018C81F72|nr:hypothetical protein [Nostoc sp. WHI]
MLIFSLSIAIAIQQLPSYIRKITTLLRNSSFIFEREGVSLNQYIVSLLSALA